MDENQNIVALSTVKDGIALPEDAGPHPEAQRYYAFLQFTKNMALYAREYMLGANVRYRQQTLEKEYPDLFTEQKQNELKSLGNKTTQDFMKNEDAWNSLIGDIKNYARNGEMPIL